MDGGVQATHRLGEPEQSSKVIMSDQLASFLSTGGAGVAVTVVTVIFLRFLREECNHTAVARDQGYAIPVLLKE